MSPVGEMRNAIRSEADRLKAEREARQRRHDVLHVAGQVAGGMMASPLGAKAPMQGIADAAVKIAELVIDAVDRVGSPIARATIDPITEMPTIGGAQ